jgi:hypothetical protein
MSEQIYELAFYGKLVEGSDLQQTKEQIAQLFKTNLEQVERMFTGHRVVIRNKLDQDTAGKYLQALRKRGADCQIEQMGQPGVAVSFDAIAQTHPATQESPKGAPVNDQSAYSQAVNSVKPAEQPVTTSKKPERTKPGMSATGLPIVGERVDAILSDTHFDLAPVGTRMEDKKPDAHVEFHALDDVTLAPPGTVLTEKKDAPPVAVPDISHLTLAPEDE